MINTKVEAVKGWHKVLIEILTDAPHVSSQVLDNVVIAITNFCESNSIELYTERDLSLISARSFHATGHVKIAEHILIKCPFFKHNYKCWINRFDSINNFTEMFPFFTRQVFLPYNWIGSTDTCKWILNLENLSISKKELHELMVYQSVCKLIKISLSLWDSTNGAGLLGIKGLKSDVLNTLFYSSKFNHASELVFLAKKIFEHNQHYRRWHSIPEVIVL